MPINLNDAAKGAAKQLADAFKAGQEEDVAKATKALTQSIADDLAAQYEAAVASNDRAVLAQRGFRQLTSAETKYYQRVIDALASPNPRQAFADFDSVPEKAMPATIFDEVMQQVTTTHPLLAAVNVVSTGYLTEWVSNGNAAQLAAWGPLGAEITKEITGAVKVVDVKQGKLSAFAVLSRDMLALGPTWFDGFVRATLGEAIACALEQGIVDGKGAAGEPIGLDRDIHSGVSYSTTTGYPTKEAVAVTDFTPATFGGLVAKLAKDEGGKVKPVDFMGQSGLALICSPTDYLTKVMPATTVLTHEGAYVNNLLPVPCQVITSAACTDGTAILALMGEYQLFVGGNRGIEYSDEAKFLEDQRAFKQVVYANGSARDNTSAITLDISKLDPAYLNVTVKGTVTTKAQA